MAVIDTNLLVRIITGDDIIQVQKASNWIKQYSTTEIKLPDFVMVELCFVLEFWPEYKMARANISRAIEDLLLTPQLRVSKYCEQALKAYAQFPKLDMADCLLLARAQLDGEEVLTFDKALLKVMN